MRFSVGLIGIIIVFFIAVWAGAKWPSLNLIGKVIPSS